MAVHLCHQKNLDTLMSLEHNWSEELIGQFYANAYFEDNDDGSEERKNAVNINSNERKINQILRNNGHEIPPESEDEDYIDLFMAYEAEVATRAAGASSSRAPQDSDEETKEEESEEAEGEEDNDENNDDEDDDIDDDEE
uniref:Uncharacterized protein n=1 Tax=Oryza brachyantha TaxID=4533 RepID=J3MSD5_ORYBR